MERDHPIDPSEASIFCQDHSTSSSWRSCGLLASPPYWAISLPIVSRSIRLNVFISCVPCSSITACAAMTGHDLQMIADPRRVVHGLARPRHDRVGGVNSESISVSTVCRRAACDFTLHRCGWPVPSHNEPASSVRRHTPISNRPKQPIRLRIDGNKVSTNVGQKSACSRDAKKWAGPRSRL